MLGMLHNMCLLLSQQFCGRPLGRSCFRLGHVGLTMHAADTARYRLWCNTVFSARKQGRCVLKLVTLPGRYPCGGVRARCKDLPTSVMSAWNCLLLQCPMTAQLMQGV
jgi:hypothetical protein